MCKCSATLSWETPHSHYLKQKPVSKASLRVVQRGTKVLTILIRMKRMPRLLAGPPDNADHLIGMELLSPSQNLQMNFSARTH